MTHCFNKLLVVFSFLLINKVCTKVCYQERHKFIAIYVELHQSLTEHTACGQMNISKFDVTNFELNLMSSKRFIKNAANKIFKNL